MWTHSCQCVYLEVQDKTRTLQNSIGNCRVGTASSCFLLLYSICHFSIRSAWDVIQEQSGIPTDVWKFLVVLEIWLRFSQQTALSFKCNVYLWCLKVASESRCLGMHCTWPQNSNVTKWGWTDSRLSSNPFDSAYPPFISVGLLQKSCPVDYVITLFIYLYPAFSTPTPLGTRRRLTTMLHTIP